MVFQGRLIYTYVLNRGGKGVRSPADGLAKGIGDVIKPKQLITP